MNSLLVFHPLPSGQRVVPWNSLLIGLLSLLLSTCADVESFYFDDMAIKVDGEWWRLFSGQLVHSSRSHLFWDLLAFVGFAGYVEHFNRRLMQAVTISGLLFVNLLLLSPLSSFNYYCGLSGVLFAPLFIAVILYGNSHRGITAWIPAIACIAKLAWDLSQQTMFLVNSAWAAYPMAHLAGLVGGVLGWALYRIFSIELSQPKTRPN